MRNGETRDAGADVRNDVPSGPTGLLRSVRRLSAWALFLLSVSSICLFLVAGAIPSYDPERFGILLNMLGVPYILGLLFLTGLACWVFAVILVVGDMAYRLARRRSLEWHVSSLFWAASAVVVLILLVWWRYGA